MTHAAYTDSWWRPLSKPDELSDEFWLAQPTIGYLPDKPWTAGEARPATALPMATQTAGHAFSTSLAVAIGSAHWITNHPGHATWTMGQAGGIALGLAMIPFLSLVGSSVKSITARGMSWKSLRLSAKIGVASMFESAAQSANGLVAITSFATSFVWRSKQNKTQPQTNIERFSDLSQGINNAIHRSNHSAAV